MKTILVTGGTGSLGRPTVEHLRAAGHEVRVLSRRTGPGLVTGDLTTGSGIDAAVDGVDTIVHLATAQGRQDVQQTRNLLQAAPATTQVLYMSIVGIDRIPLAYYRHKLEASGWSSPGTAYTILRATQFHNLLDRVFSVKMPAIFAPAVTLQPIAVEDVATRLTELVGEPVNGRAADIGGPEVRPVPELARAWKAARGSRRPVVPVRVPGKIFRAFVDGHANVDGPSYGRITFEEHVGGKGRYVRSVLVVFAAYELVLGVWMTFFPAQFYELPTVDWTPPYSEHLFRDFGGATLGLAIVLDRGGDQLRPAAHMVALLAYLAFAVPHLVFHLGHLEGDSPGWSIVLAVVTALSVLVPASALIAARRMT